MGAVEKDVLLILYIMSITRGYKGVTRKRPSVKKCDC